ncbi:MAG: PTS sugar transporter subunit IIA [Termitinemataceae bacterium]|nr:MAG: PTS sugar transporter subunit IIA [Termitinemataceae bacterium]
MSLSEIFDQKSIIPSLAGKTKLDVFKELIERIAAANPELDKDTMFTAIQDREQKLNTSIAPGVAVPHGYYPGIDGIFGALGISQSGIEYESLDSKPVHCVLLLIMGESAREKHLRVLNRIAFLINSGGTELLLKAKGKAAINEILSHIQF